MMARDAVTVSMSAPNRRTWALPCDWTPLNLMNCKSRAEAFAKRLHTKLRSLGASGGIGIVDECDDLEEEDDDDPHPQLAPDPHPRSKANSNVDLNAPMNGAPANGDGNFMIVNRFWDEHVRMLTIHQPQPAPTDLHSTFNFFGGRMDMNGLHEPEEDDYLMAASQQLSLTLPLTSKSNVDIGQGLPDPKPDTLLNGTSAPPGGQPLNPPANAECFTEEEENCQDGNQKPDLTININGKVEEEDDDDDDEEDPEVEPQRVQRSSSLRTCKTPPGTPAAAKKMVRFADALGLDLEDVKTIFLDDLPVVPRSAFAHLSEPSLLATEEPNHPPAPWHWVPGFTPPAALPDFKERLHGQKVCLETAAALDCGAVHAVIRVLNVHYEKRVSVRLSRDDWVTRADAGAAYVPGSCDGHSDKFSVVMYADAAGGRSLSFAVRYEVLGHEYWDNNRGRNYVFRSFPDVPRRAAASPVQDDESWLRFA